MTTRELYINLLDREPDFETTQKYMCVEKLGVYMFSTLKSSIKKSDEFKCINAVPDKSIVKCVRDVYLQSTGDIHGAGVYHYAKLIQHNYLSIEKLYQILSVKFI